MSILNGQVEHLYLEVCERCNLGCSHCVVQRSTRGVTPVDHVGLVKLLSGFVDQGGRYVTLSGGEPGLRTDLEQLITISIRLGLKVTLFTNGLAASPSVLETLAAAEGKLAVSLDGPSAAVHEAMRGQGTFAPVVCALRRGINRLGGAAVILSAVLSRPLLPHLDDLWDFACELGVGVLYLGFFEPVAPQTRHPLMPEASELVGPVLHLIDLAERDENSRLLFSESGDLLLASTALGRRSAEAALGRTVKVTADGQAFPGPFYYEDQFRLGRPLSEGWGPMMSSSVIRQLAAQSELRPMCVPNCRGCFWASRCRGGSLALTWATHADWSQPCPLCDLYQAALERVLSREVSGETAVVA